MAEKTCRLCRAVKQDCDFYKGRHQCKTCLSQRCSARQQTAEWRERHRQSNRAYRASGRQADSVRRWRERHPDRYRAHNVLWNELKYGRMKPEPCGRCGAEKAHAHHHDYSKPLEVTWLCPGCHAAEHKKMREA